LAVAKSIVVPITASWVCEQGPNHVSSTGVLYLDDYSHILSCAHLPTHGATYRATLLDDEEVELELAFSNNEQDVAVFLVKAYPPHALPRGPRATLPVV
jgi:hypothetical protein